MQSCRTCRPVNRQTGGHYEIDSLSNNICFFISAGILVYVFPRTVETPLSSMTTIGQFNEEIAALANKTPTGLI